MLGALNALGRKIKAHVTFAPEYNSEDTAARNIAAELKAKSQQPSSNNVSEIQNTIKWLLSDVLIEEVTYGQAPDPDAMNHNSVAPAMRSVPISSKKTPKMRCDLLVKKNPRALLPLLKILATHNLYEDFVKEFNLRSSLQPDTLQRFHRFLTDSKIAVSKVQVAPTSPAPVTSTSSQSTISSSLLNKAVKTPVSTEQVAPRPPTPATVSRLQITNSESTLDKIAKIHSKPNMQSTTRPDLNFNLGPINKSRLNPAKTPTTAPKAYVTAVRQGPHASITTSSSEITPINHKAAQRAKINEELELDFIKKIITPALEVAISAEDQKSVGAADDRSAYKNIENFHKIITMASDRGVITEALQEFLKSYDPKDHYGLNEKLNELLEQIDKKVEYKERIEKISAFLVVLNDFILALGIRLKLENTAALSTDLTTQHNGPVEPIKIVVANQSFINVLGGAQIPTLDDRTPAESTAPTPIATAEPVISNYIGREPVAPQQYAYDLSRLSFPRQLPNQTAPSPALAGIFSSSSSAAPSSRGTIVDNSNSPSAPGKGQSGGAN